MSYATFADVQARAGRASRVFEVEGKHPNQADIEAILDDVSALIDTAIRSRGFDPAAMAVSVSDALRDLAAYGALARGLAAADPSGRPGLMSGLSRAETIWTSGINAIFAGTYGPILELEAGGTGTSAGSLGIDDPSYGQHLSPQERIELNADFAPGFARTQKL